MERGNRPCLELEIVDASSVVWLTAVTAWNDVRTVSFRNNLRPITTPKPPAYILYAFSRTAAYRSRHFSKDKHTNVS